MVCPWDSLGKNTGVVAIPFSRGSFWPRDRIEVSCITGRFLTIWDTLLSGTKGKKNVLKCVISLLLDRLSASWGRDLNVYHLDLSRAYILPAFGEFIIWKVETKQKIKKKKKKRNPEKNALFSVVFVSLAFLCSQYRGPRFNPGQGTRSHMLTMPPLKILSATMKIKDPAYHN